MPTPKTPKGDHGAVFAILLGIVGAIVSASWWNSLEPAIHYVRPDEPADPTWPLVLMGVSLSVIGLGILYFVIRFAIQDALLTEHHIEDAPTPNAESYGPSGEAS